MAPPAKTDDAKKWTSLVLNKEIGGLKTRKRKGTEARENSERFTTAFSNADIQRPPWAWNESKGAKPKHLDESQSEILDKPPKQYLSSHDHPSRPEGWITKNGEADDWTICGLPGTYIVQHQGATFPCTDLMEDAIQQALGTEKDKVSPTAVADAIWKNLSDRPVGTDTTKTVKDIVQDPGCLYIMKRDGGEGIEWLDTYVFVWYARRHVKFVNDGKTKMKWIRCMVAPRNEHIMEMFSTKLPDLLPSVLEDPFTRLFRKTIHKAFYSYNASGGFTPSEQPIEWTITYPVFPISLVWNAWCEKMYPACAKKKGEGEVGEAIENTEMDGDPEDETKPEGPKASKTIKSSEKLATAESSPSPKVQMTLAMTPVVDKPKRKYKKRTPAVPKETPSDEAKPKTNKRPRKVNAGKEIDKKEVVVQDPPVKKQRVVKPTPAPVTNRKRSGAAEKFTHSDLDNLESSLERCRSLIGKLEKSGQTSNAKIDLFTEWSGMTAQTKSFLLSMQWVCNEHGAINEAFTTAVSRMRDSLPALQEEEKEQADDDEDLALLAEMFDSAPAVAVKKSVTKPKAKPVTQPATKPVTKHVDKPVVKKRRLIRKRFFDSEAEDDGDMREPESESESESDSSLYRNGFIVPDGEEDDPDDLESLGSEEEEAAGDDSDEDFREGEDEDSEGCDDDGDDDDDDESGDQ